MLIEPMEFLKTKDVQLAYDSFGIISHKNTPAHLLLLINGFQRTRQDFRALRQKIITKVPNIITIAFDNRFCGQTRIISHPEKDLSLIDFANDSLALLKHCIHLFQIDKVHVLGISMGGMIAQILASLSECPKIETLFLVSTTAGGSHRVWPVEPYLRNNASNNFTNDTQTEERIAQYFGDKFLKNSPLFFKMFVKNIQKNSQSEDAQESFKQQAMVSKNFEGVNDFTMLKSKNVVIITGNEDKIMPVKNSEILADLIPGSQLIVYPQVGHIILTENPNEFADDIANILNRKDIKS